jgi:hypothetical protein
MPGLPSAAGLRKLDGQHSLGNRPITSICASAWTAPGNAGPLDARQPDLTRRDDLAAVCSCMM